MSTILDKIAAIEAEVRCIIHIFFFTFPNWWRCTIL